MSLVTESVEMCELIENVKLTFWFYYFYVDPSYLVTFLVFFSLFSFSGQHDSNFPSALQSGSGLDRLVRCIKKSIHQEQSIHVTKQDLSFGTHVTCVMKMWTGLVQC